MNDVTVFSPDRKAVIYRDGQPIPVYLVGSVGPQGQKGDTGAGTNDPTKVLKSGDNMTGDLWTTGKFVSTTADAVQPWGFSHERAGRVGYHLYNSGAICEWVIYQPAHAVGDNLRIATRVAGVDTDVIAFQQGGVNIAGDLTVNHGDGTGYVWLGNTGHFVRWDGTRFGCNGELIVDGGAPGAGTTISATAIAIDGGNLFFQYAGATGYIRTTAAGADLWLGAGNTNYLHIVAADGRLVSVGSAFFKDVTADRGDGTGVVWFSAQSNGKYIYLQSTGFFVNGSDWVTQHQRPGADNTWQIGNASMRYTVIFAVTGAINTSDERDKEQIAPPTDAVLDAWAEVEWVSYKWKDAVAEKGDGARLHIGLIAQRVAAVFEAHGLDGFALGLLCYDEWPETVSSTLEPAPASKRKARRGKVADDEALSPEMVALETVIPAGDRFGVRYEEALALEAALGRRERSRLEARLAALEGGAR